MAKKILIVDDSISLRQSLRFILEEHNFEAFEATDGVEGLSRLNEGKFDLVLSDVNMPNMDGLTMLRKNREQGINRFTPVLILTTESQGSVIEEGKRSGATGWIVKPFTNDKLITAIQRILG